MAERRWLWRMRVRARDGRGWLISAQEVGWGRWGHTSATCTRGGAGGMAGDVRRSGGQWRATSGAPAGGSAPSGAAHLPRTARVSSRWLRHLGVRVRHGYGAYGGWPMWPCTTSRQSVSRRSQCFCISLSSFQNSFSLNFQTKVHLMV
jgi:hypothetical protein